MLKPVSNNIQEYLNSSIAIDWHHPTILDRVRELTIGLSEELAIAQRLFEWVRDEIPHSKDIDSDVVTFTASEVLARGTGICYAKSHLLAAMLRATSIPAGLCYQLCATDPPVVSLELHGFNAIYLTSLERWIRVDPRGNTGDIDARFYLEEERLAFPPNPDLGEYIFAEIWSEPIPEVVDLLTTFTSRRDMWSHLPNGIETGAIVAK